MFVQIPRLKVLPFSLGLDYSLRLISVSQSVNHLLIILYAGHPADAGASCGLCGGGGARVRCAECGRRALCASCDDMYHRHPKRRHHQRQVMDVMRLPKIHKIGR